MEKFNDIEIIEEIININKNNSFDSHGSLVINIKDSTQENKSNNSEPKISKISIKTEQENNSTLQWQFLSKKRKKDESNESDEEYSISIKKENMENGTT